ncbi:MAG TPA: hypothetical protein DCL44_06760 [Elusimicrobia bacterium]|nr:hypothetical protein [Elusimicrobiota bacterium]
MPSNTLEKLEISEKKLQEINSFLTSPSNALVSDLMKVIAKYGSIEEINAKAEKAQNLDNQLAGLSKINSPYLKDLEWLMKAKAEKAFIGMEEYRRRELGANYQKTHFDSDFAVTLEISALQYFPWFITEAKRAIEKKELMPARFIRVRYMKEQEAQKDGELTAIAAGMNILGATYVETLDTKGTDGANVHLGGPDTITGYFGGVGQPNDYALKWVDEFLYYYTNYGVKQVLNVNPGTILLGYMLHKLGINNEFKISVFMGNDNPYSVLWTLMTAKLFSRDDGSTPLIGFNFSNSVNNRTIELSAQVRSELSLEACVRFEHHITETWKSIVRQPYDRTAELLEIGKKVRNISAKHEGGPVKVEEKRDHPSNILEYFIPKTEVMHGALMPKLEQNYLDKHEAVNLTASALTKNGIPVIAAPGLHEGR